MPHPRCLRNSPRACHRSYPAPGHPCSPARSPPPLRRINRRCSRRPVRVRSPALTRPYSPVCSPLAALLRSRRLAPRCDRARNQHRVRRCSHLLNPPWYRPLCQWRTPVCSLVRSPLRFRLYSRLRILLRCRRSNHPHALRPCPACSLPANHLSSHRCSRRRAHRNNRARAPPCSRPFNRPKVRKFTQRRNHLGHHRCSLRWPPHCNPLRRRLRSPLINRAVPLPSSRQCSQQARRRCSRSCDHRLFLACSRPARHRNNRRYYRPWSQLTNPHHRPLVSPAFSLRRRLPSNRLCDPRPFPRNNRSCDHRRFPVCSLQADRHNNRRYYRPWSQLTNPHHRPRISPAFSLRRRLPSNRLCDPRPPPPHSRLLPQGFGRPRSLRPFLRVSRA
jgi:hypothetical protein